MEDIYRNKAQVYFRIFCESLAKKSSGDIVFKGLQRGIVEVKGTRGRALTLYSISSNRNVVGCRNKRSPREGIEICI